MPPAYALGFHFSKWGKITAKEMMRRNDNFNQHNFPVDVLWMDIDHTHDYQYFEFNNKTFTPSQIEQMNKEVERWGRRFVVITDCHIKAELSYSVYADGLQMESDTKYHMYRKDPLVNISSTEEGAGNFTNIFVKNAFGGLSKHECWPKKAVWFDFLNTHAQTYWKDLLRGYEGTNEFYSYWIDMNEPSVFNSEARTLPLSSLHYTADGEAVLHRDLHNMYGTL